MGLTDDREILGSVLDVKSGDLQCPVPGCQVDVVDVDHFHVVDVIASLGGHPGSRTGHGVGRDVVVGGRGRGG